MIENKHDWKIHKILDEANRVYICPARGNGKFYNQLELYADLFTQKKDIHIIRAEDVKKAVDFKDIFIDKDLYYHHEPPWLKPELDKYFEEEMHKYLEEDRRQWKPKIIHDTTVVNPAFWEEWNMWNVVYDGFIVRPEEDKL